METREVEYFRIKDDTYDAGHYFKFNGRIVIMIRNDPEEYWAVFKDCTGEEFPLRAEHLDPATELDWLASIIELGTENGR